MGGRKGKSRHGLIVKHTTVVLDIDIDRATVSGYVDMQFRAKTKLPNLRLHARQMAIQKVLYNGNSTEFQYVDYLLQPCDPQESSRSVRVFPFSL